MNLGSDIRIKGTFFSHYKTLKLAKKATWEAVTRLQQLWYFASNNRPDGNLTGMDDDDIALASGWMHETQAFVEALLSCGWLDGEPGHRNLHDYTEHQPWVQERAKKAQDGSRGGKAAAERMTDAERHERASKAGKARHASANGMLTDSLVSAKCTKQELSASAYSTKSIQLSPNQTNTKPIPDQEIEQTNNAHDAGASPGFFADGTEPKQSQKREPKPKAAINRAITFDPATFTLHGITDADRNQWRGYAPGVDVDTEIEAFLDYMQTHPEALDRTLKTGAWKAALNTRFRNAAKYGASKASAPIKVGPFASFPASIEREPQRECTEAERLAARKTGEEAYERSRQHRAFRQTGDA